MSSIHHPVPVTYNRENRPHKQYIPPLGVAGRGKLVQYVTPGFHLEAWVMAGDYLAVLMFM
jgi:hypothetical protein